jgi:hypothetical protein
MLLFSMNRIDFENVLVQGAYSCFHFPFPPAYFVHLASIEAMGTSAEILNTSSVQAPSLRGNRERWADMSIDSDTCVSTPRSHSIDTFATDGGLLRKGLWLAMVRGLDAISWCQRGYVTSVSHVFLVDQVRTGYLSWSYMRSCFKGKSTHLQKDARLLAAALSIVFPFGFVVWRQVRESTIDERYYPPFRKECKYCPNDKRIPLIVIEHQVEAFILYDASVS